MVFPLMEQVMHAVKPFVPCWIMNRTYKGVPMYRNY